MLNADKSKLIWQRDAPARFESAWCIFAKLLSLNSFKPKQLAKLISLDNKGDNYLSFLSSKWIDFRKYSAMLDVDPTLLKSGFLDQFNLYNSDEIQYRTYSGIKLCPECAKAGYHCVIFQFGFINYCPWHHLKLTSPCHGCVNYVIDRKLKSASVSDWTIEQSACGHMLYDDSKVPPLNMLSKADQSLINLSCLDFLDWWAKVAKCIEIWKFLSIPEFTYEDLDNLPKYLSASEQIAGKCPWPIETSKCDVRTISWKQAAPTPKPISIIQENSPFDAISDTIPRKSEVDIAYRSIRRYFFRRFIKPHRSCWTELSNYEYFSTQDMCSDRTCIVTMAFIAWRLSIEDFLNIEVLKTGKFRDRSIVEFFLHHDEYNPSIEAQISLIYAHFFYIWEQIDRLAGEHKFGIAQSVHARNKSHFAISYNSEEWLLLFPNHHYLEMKSFIHCCGLLKYRGWMRRRAYVDRFFLDRNAQSGWNSRLMFKLHKEIIRGGYKYINV